MRLIRFCRIASGEIRVLIELDHRTHNASEDRDRDRITAADG